jgi:hypothetical protein
MILDCRKIGYNEGKMMGGVVLLDGKPVPEVFYVDTDAGLVCSYSLHDHPDLIDRSKLGSVPDGITYTASTAIYSEGAADLFKDGRIPYGVSTEPGCAAYWERRGKVELFKAEEWAARPK